MSKWLTHVKKTMKQEKGKKKDMGKKWFSHVLKTAKHSYKKKGGNDEDENPKPNETGKPSAPAGVAFMEGNPTPNAGRRRRGGKTRRH
jgi:hypothetical protein